MKYWLVPSNDSTFRIGEAIAAQGGMADWRTNKFSEGDVVFIYKIKPDQCIRYKMEVVKTNIPFSMSLKDEDCWTDQAEFRAGVEKNNND